MRVVGWRSKVKRRMFVALIAVTGLLAIYVGRLFMLQVLEVGSFSRRGIDLVESSVYQRQQALVLDSGRGDFYDRAMRPLTGESYSALLVFPLKRTGEELKDKWPRLFAALGTSAAGWETFAKPLTTPGFWPDQASGFPKKLTAAQADTIRALRMPGIIVTDYRLRYVPPFTAGQLIGFTSMDPQRAQREFWTLIDQGRMRLDSQIGASGLEKTFEPFMAGIGPTTLSLFTDAAHQELGGLRLRQTSPANPYYPLKAVTTLDLPIQRKIEAVMDKHGLKEGAVVVLDVSDADVVTLASRPAFDPNRVDPEADNWSNQALKAIVPGSVFKTVVAAAALDTGVAHGSDTFTCNGELGKFGFSCWLPGGHGVITLKEAYAQSCNITFAKVMERVPSETLEEYARKLGLLQPIGWSGDVLSRKQFHQFDREQEGQLFDTRTDPNDEGVRVQTAIGQRDVRMTPLQAANLVVTLLHGGEVMEPRIVSELQYQTGRSLHKFSSRVLVPRSEGISATTAAQLAEWMRGVVDHGTGQSLRAADWPLAGKSGTAQETELGQPAETEWFIGYGPYPQAKYAVAVVSEHSGLKQKGTALAVFRDVMNVLAAAS